MLLIIFGAGASYDSVPSRPASQHSRGSVPHRPPLANELFHDEMTSLGQLQHFQECHPIIPYLQRPQNGKSVERVLEELRDEATHYANGHKQLASIRYYLQFMLCECEKLWTHNILRGVSNYKTLIDQVERWNKTKDKVCIVTFNYDTLIEEALSAFGAEFESINHYVSHRIYKLIKLHGSVNWGRRVLSPYISADEDPWIIGRKVIDSAPTLSLASDFSIAKSHPMAADTGFVMFPALAIPVETKKSYECPADHVDMLDELIPKASKILLIGWRGAEAHFLTKLKELAPKDLPYIVVAGSAKNASDVIDTLTAHGIDGRFMHTTGGFTEFILGREIDGFLKA